MLYSLARRHRRPALLALLLSLACLASKAETPLPLPPAVTLGASEASVRDAMGELERVRHPRRAPTGAVGLLRNPAAFVNGRLWEQTFYFDARGLAQIEWVLMPRQPAETSAESFDAMVAALRARWGSELASRSVTPGAVQQSASWTLGEEDVIATRSGSAEAPTVRIAWRLRAAKDASEL